MAASSSPRARPRVVVSKCLFGARCRYDGEVMDDDLVARLGGLVEFRPVCPEMEMGLGVPRAPIRVVRQQDGLRLVQPETGRELTMAMTRFSRRFLAGVGAVDGFLLKSRSPSCAVRDAAVYGRTGRLLAARRPGFFAAAVRARFPLVPVEDERRLRSPVIYRRFVEALLGQGRPRGADASPARLPRSSRR
jgi:uncharacterized protein YbbK (DUF523 family)